MVGNQEGTQNDYGWPSARPSSRPASSSSWSSACSSSSRMTFWPLITPYLYVRACGRWPSAASPCWSSMTLLKWSDDGRTDSGKFSAVADKAANTDGLAPVAKLFFSSYVGWICSARHVRRRRSRHPGLAQVPGLGRPRCSAWSARSGPTPPRPRCATSSARPTTPSAAAWRCSAILTIAAAAVATALAQIRHR